MDTKSKLKTNIDFFKFRMTRTVATWWVTSARRSIACRSTMCPASWPCPIVNARYLKLIYLAVSLSVSFSLKCRSLTIFSLYLSLFPYLFPSLFFSVFDFFTILHFHDHAPLSTQGAITNLSRCIAVCLLLFQCRSLTIISLYLSLFPYLFFLLSSPLCLTILHM